MILISLLSASTVSAQAGSPWENAANLLQTSFTGPLARALSLIAIDVFGLGMALGAVNFMSWLFGVA